MSSEKVVLGYWGIRGLGQIPRLLLAYTGANWEDVKYVGREQWHEKDKKDLGLDFPNLPYLIEGDFKITESRAVNLYIISRSDKKDLLGKNIKDQAVVEQIIGVLNDVRTPVSGLLFDKQWKDKLPGVLEKVGPKLDALQKFCGQKQFFLGYLTLADFLVTEFSFYLEKIAPEAFAKYSFLAKIRKSFEDLPEIKKYYESETAVKGPFFPPGFGVIDF